MNDRKQESHLANRTYRVVGAIFGLLVTLSGLYVLLDGPWDALRILGAALLLAMGINLLAASWRGRASWLSRIGPLP